MMIFQLMKLRNKMDLNVHQHLMVSLSLNMLVASKSTTIITIIIATIILATITIATITIATITIATIILTTITIANTTIATITLATIILATITIATITIATITLATITGMVSFFYFISDTLTNASRNTRPPIKGSTGRRQRLPCPRASQSLGMSIWSVMRRHIGKDLSKVSMPVEFNEPLNTLQVQINEMINQLKF